MARDDSRAQSRRAAFLLLLDGTRPSGPLEWVPRVAPVAAQAAVGAGHWAAGRRQRALAAWISAAGFALGAWGLGTEALTQAEAERLRQQQKDLLRKPGTEATPAPTARQRARRARYEAAFSVAGMVIRVRYDLRNPRRLTALAIADEAPAVVFHVLRVPRAVQRRRPRMAAGSVLIVAGAVARLRAASAEPLR